MKSARSRAAVTVAAAGGMTSKRERETMVAKAEEGFRIRARTQARNANTNTKHDFPIGSNADVLPMDLRPHTNFA